MHDFEPKSGWNSADDDLVNNFYKPALVKCKRYDRLTGFFSSNAFAVAIREVLDFVERGGRIRLITSAQFSQADLDVISKNVDTKIMEEVTTALEDDIGRKCLAVFGHMLSTDINGTPQLEIKILVPERGIFHPKVGVFVMDNGDMISFSGSANETGMGWAGNIEEFKAFCSWNDREFVDIDTNTFQKFWTNNYTGIRTYDLPTAVREKILSVRPDSEKEYRELLQELKETMYGKTDSADTDRFELRDYQKEAIDAWVSRGYRGILEMPTATGKTFTAMGCINKLQRKYGRLFTVIAVPYRHLTRQWLENVRKWNSLVLPEQRISSYNLNTATSKNWKRDLTQAMVQFNKKKFGGGYVMDDYIICTTYNILFRPEFIKIIQNVDGEVLLVADEAHHTGSAAVRNGLIEKYSARLALTATPKRYFDDEGSEVIQSYFNNIAYSMEIGVAIKSGYLVPYNYYPVFVELNALETDEYVKLTRAIAINRENNEDRQSDDMTRTLENKRARLVAKADQKHQKLAALLEIHGNILENTLIYCHDGQQLGKVGQILSNLNVSYEIINDASSMMERRNTIESLTDKNHQCIVAMKCLDEGVDIPSAQLGIIMASTGNSLQYIQRRGRFLRKSKGKDRSAIYDILVAVPENEGIQPFARKLVAKELLRHKEFAADALNKDDALDMIRPVANRYGIDLDRLNIQYILGF